MGAKRKAQTATGDRPLSVDDRPLSVETDERWTTTGISAPSRNVSVQEIMTREVVTLPPRAHAIEAAKTLRDENIGFLPVAQPDGTVVGVVTDRDLVLRLLAEELPDTTPVEELMTEDVIYCHSGDDLGVAEHLMRLNQVSRLVVLGDNQLLAGVLSLTDLAEYEEACRVAEVAADISGREVDLR